MNLGFPVPLNCLTAKVVRFADLLNPAFFDQTKHCINKLGFSKFEYLYDHDPLFRCRNAELLIDKNALEQALGLLSELDGLLAEGLMATALVGLNAYSVAQVYTQPYTHWSIEKCLSCSPNQQEGLIHMFLAAYALAIESKNLDYALYLINRVAFLANELGLKNRLKQIRIKQTNLNKMV